MKQELNSKHLLRKDCLIKMGEVSPDQRQEDGKKVADKIFNMLKKTNLKITGVAYFKNFKGEIDTSSLGEMLKEEGYERFLPKVNPDSSLFFFKEDTREPVPLEAFSVIIAPGLAFDRQGYRLGRGLGCYDRFLAKFRLKKTKPLIIGIGFDFQLFDKIPVEANDQRLNVVVTPSFEIIT